MNRSQPRRGAARVADNRFPVAAPVDTPSLRASAAPPCGASGDRRIRGCIPAQVLP